MKEITRADKITMLKVKSLLNHLSYIIKEEDKPIVEEYHNLCRKHCSWGKGEQYGDV